MLRLATVQCLGVFKIIDSKESVDVLATATQKLLEIKSNTSELRADLTLSTFLTGKL